MKTLKLVLWIFVLYMIQNIFYPIISVTGIIPDVLLGFAVSYAALEHRFGKLSPVIIICAVLAGTGTGRVFPIVTALVGFGGIASYIICGYMRFIPQFIRTQAVTAVFAFLMCIAEFFVSEKTVTYGFIINTALWYMLYTTAVSCVIYLILKRVMFKDTERKLLVAQERN